MILRHRDRELLRFEWLDPEGVRIYSVNEAELKFLPFEMRGEATDTRYCRIEGNGKNSASGFRPQGRVDSLLGHGR